MGKNIKTVSDAIEALGGSGKIATRYGLRTNAVCNWRIKDKIPERYRLSIYLDLKREGYKPSRDLVGILPEVLDEIDNITAVSA